MKRKIKFGLKKEKKKPNRLSLLVLLGLILIVSLFVVFISALETNSNFAGQAFQNSGDSPFYSFGQNIYRQLISGKDFLTGAVIGTQDLTPQATVTCYNCSDCDTNADTSGTYLVLGNNVTTTGNCISVATTSNGVTLDCQGYSITGDNSGSTDYSINIPYGTSDANVTILNCSIYNSGGAGVYIGRPLVTIGYVNFYNSTGKGIINLQPNVKIHNSTFTGTGDALNFAGSTFIRNVEFINNVINSTGSKNGISMATGTDVESLTVQNSSFNWLTNGISLAGGSGSIKENVTILNNKFFNATTAAIALTNYGSHLLIRGNTIDGNGQTTDCLDIDSIGTVTNYTIRNNLFTNCPNDNVDFVAGTDVPSCSEINFIENVLDPAGDITSQINCSIYLINNTFNKSAIVMSKLAGITEDLVYVSWYVDVTVTDTSGNPLQNANVTAYNVTPVSIYTALTDAGGQLPRLNLTEFYQKNSTFNGYETPHNFSVTLTNYIPNSTTINLSSTEGTSQIIVLSLNIFPDLKINSSDIVYTGQTVRHNDNLTFNITLYNNGDDNATNANVSFYINEIINHSVLVNITTNSTSNLTFSWTTRGGNHTFSAKADPGSLISELNRTNNNATINLSIKYVAVLDYLSPVGSFPRGKNIAGEDALSEISDFLTVSGRVYDFYNSSHRFSANCTIYFNDSYLGSNTTNSSGECIFRLNKTAYNFGMYNLSINFTGLEGEAVSHTSQTQNSTNISIFVMSITPNTIDHYGGLNYMIGEAAVINFSVTKNNSAYAPDTVTLAILGATDPEDTTSIYPSELHNDGSGFYRYASKIESAPNGGSVRWKIRINSTAEGLIATASHSDITVNSADSSLNLTVVNSSNNFIANSIITLKDSLGYSLNQTNGCNLSKAVRKNKNHSLEISTPAGETIILKNVYLNRTNNNLTLQILASRNVALPSGFKNLTPIIAFEEFPFAFETANLTLPNYGQNIASVQKCSVWNITLSNCTGTWSNYQTEINQNSTHFWFNVTSFSGYAGGIGYNSNLTIWDQNDTGLFGADFDAYANLQIKFYANYSNATDNIIITGANCNISFNVSPGGPSNMPFNSTNNLYQYNRTFSSAGGYSWNVTCGGNSSFDTLTAVDTITIATAGPDTSPRWERNITNIVATYSPTTFSYFNISWLDDDSFHMILFESNYTGIALNYSMNNVSGIYNNATVNFSAIMPAGTFYWKSYANDSANQWNYTDAWTFVVARAASSVNLTLNGLEGNLTVYANSGVSINCSRVNGEGNITIFRNGTFINTSSHGEIFNLTNFTQIGVYNLSCEYAQTQNYSAGLDVLWVNVTAAPDNPPYWQNNTVNIAATYSSTTLSYFNISWLDDNAVSLAYFESDYAGTPLNYSMNLINSSFGTYNFSAIMPAGTFYWKSYANDSANQWNYTDAWTFVVAQAASSVNLTINGTENHLNLTAVSTLNISCTRISGEGNIYLYRNNTLLNFGSLSISNLTSFSLSEAYNISCQYNSTQNYSSSLKSYLILAGIDYGPNVTLVLPPAGHSDSSATESTTAYNITFNCSASDDYQLKNISLYLTNPESFALNQSANLSGTSNSTLWSLLLNQGTYLWNCLAYDNRSQSAFASNNRTITLSYTASSSSSSSGGGGGGGSTRECYTDLDCPAGKTCQNYRCLTPELEIKCSSDIDCGGREAVEDSFCSGNRVYRKFRDNRCKNPGTKSADCSAEIINEETEFCEFGCSGGQCLLKIEEPAEMAETTNVSIEEERMARGRAVKIAVIIRNALGTGRAFGTSLWQGGIVSYSYYWLAVLMILSSLAFGFLVYQQIKSKSEPIYPEEIPVVPKEIKPVGEKPIKDWRTVKDHYRQKLETIDLSLKLLQEKEPELRPAMFETKKVSRKISSGPETISRVRVNIPKYRSPFKGSRELSQELSEIEAVLKCKDKMLPKAAQARPVKMLSLLPAKKKKGPFSFSLIPEELRVRARTKSLFKKRNLQPKFSSELEEIQEKLKRF